MLIRLSSVINVITVLQSAFEPNKEARDANTTPVPNLTIRELKPKHNAERELPICPRKT